MGYPNNTHIKSFIKGQVLENIVECDRGSITLQFRSGESLRLWPRVKRQPAPVLETIATPFRKDGEVKQTTELGQPIEGSRLLFPCEVTADSWKSWFTVKSKFHLSRLSGATHWRPIPA